ncbi:glycosyltransferase [Paenibacillus qinlingensis]|uniref:Glycosyltransferase involved in cell wall biosynthesis n=1 Tax=Paenibacillus qinlingensis TaxID=1837343 RepID=A0ABU1P4Y8_9BACL|nr:glycosyltransferase [Paenibacillus qinlingensis]MDR6554654.1 glycosyltransferase involved in cell wall biosynthesis [Paenibacillus qinlingensis]
MRVLIGSPVCQAPSILRLFLQSLHLLSVPTAEVHYLFIDDNSDGESKQLLRQFQEDHLEQTTIFHENATSGNYYRDQLTHHWNDKLIWKVAVFKNRIIEHALENDYDALLLIDSDLLLRPETLDKLLESDKSIISEIFWTHWQTNSIPLPQVWVSDEYIMFERIGREVLSKEQEIVRQHRFLARLRQPGVYEVGGLGACTCIRKDALQKGVNFNKINNLSFWGEDRHFCIRAQVLGFSLFVDTHYPAFHIYRETDLPGAEDFMRRYHVTPSTLQPLNETEVPPTILFPTPTIARPKLTLSMIVHNEAGKYLEQVLTKHRAYIDEAVIIDDGSSDNSSEICREILKGIPLHLIRNETANFNNEVMLRKQQWEETIRREPEWILNMDADEEFEEGFASDIASVLQQVDGDVGCFRLYDMWSDTHYREDEYWRAHFVYRPLLLRYRKNFAFKWKEQPLHCGRFPDNMFDLPAFILPNRVKHLGWSTPEIRAHKYERYMRLDPDGSYGWKEQYESILDPAPRLVKWSE